MYCDVAAGAADVSVYALESFLGHWRRVRVELGGRLLAYRAGRARHLCFGHDLGPFVDELPFYSLSENIVGRMAESKM
jgi:hypothetical protein